MRYVYHDGGREKAGYKGSTDDCVVRAVSIISGIPYNVVYDKVNQFAKTERASKNKRGKSSARRGVYKGTTKKIMAEFGMTWTPTMSIGSGCTVHLRAGELPSGRIIASVSKHVVAVIDGVIHDTYDPSRGGTRCVYGYWK